MKDSVRRAKYLLKTEGLRGLGKALYRMIIHKFPQMRILITDIYNHVEYGRSSPDPLQTIYIDPNKITHYTKRYTHPLNLGKIEKGNWDLNANKLQSHPKYRSICAHFRAGVPWKDTEVYDYLAEYIDRYEYVDGCSSREDIIKRYQNVDQLYTNMRESGYKTQETPESYWDIDTNKLDMITVNIGRDGKFIFNSNGWHRLTICKLLNVDSVPVLVGTRHTQWQRIRERFHQRNGELDGIDQFEEHPDIISVRSTSN